MTGIADIHAREILDSRGKPTVEVEILLESGIRGRASVPSGASTGSHEATEIRDGDNTRYFGQGVLDAIGSVNGEIFDTLSGQDVEDQVSLDKMMIALDGTSKKERLGANAILGVSLAAAKTAALQARVPLYTYLGGVSSYILPVPMMNIINGGAHADNLLDIQEFMVVPSGASCFSDALRWGAEIFQSLRSRLRDSGHSTAVGDEGGFAPDLSSNENALEVIVESISDTGLKPGVDVLLSVDVAANEFLEANIYSMRGEGKNFNSDELISYLQRLTEQFPISSIEDPLGEDDWDGWQEITKRLGHKIQLVGDDLFVTNKERLERGIKNNTANAILIKMNQIGTVTETIEAIGIAHRAGYSSIVSHRSGETEDTSIADLSVATSCGQIKTGSLSRSDRVAKYNQLLRIEEHLGKNALYGLPEKNFGQ